LRQEDQAPSHETRARAGSGWSIPTVYKDWVKALTGSEDTSDDDVRAKVEPNRARLERLRDPFTPLARGDEAARAKEKVLWEDGQFLVISDTFAGGAKALVIPARPCLVPVDLDEGERARIEEITGAVVEAFRVVTGKDSRAWVNLPNGISVRQLHVHVQPNHSDKSAEDEVATWLAEHLGSAQPQEVEIKLGLDGEDALERLKAAIEGDVSPTVTQTNNFFDTDAGALDDARCTCRVREERGPSGTEWTLTLKGVEKTDGELSQKAESEWVIDEEAARALLGGEDPLAKARALDDGSGAGLLAHLEGLAAGEGLKHIGAFTNERTRVRTTLEPGDAVFELDKTTFPGDRVDCELELEVPEDQADAYRVAVTGLVDKAGVKTHKAKSKAARFFKALRENG
jgi:uncharacterized protein YjbK